jgi:alkylhydroperoxidase family enzyme
MSTSSSTSPAPVRIAPAAPPYEPAISESFASIMPSGMEPLVLFRTMARNPRVLQRMFAASLLDKGTITLREREILILRTCARCGSEYEWGVHVTLFSKRAGLSEPEIAATAAPSISDIWPAREAALIHMADELRASADLSQAAWDSLARHYTGEQILELILLCGYYHAISFMTNVLRLEPETFAARFPPAPSGAR